MSKNISCFYYQPRSPTPGSLKHYLAICVFPTVFSIGIIGSVLNLIVLSKMKLKHNRFLSSTAVTDIGYFLVTFVANLSAYETLATSPSFVQFYFRIKMTLNILSSWFSSAAIWFAVLTIVERLIAQKYSFRLYYFWTPCRFANAVVAVCSTTFVLQCYQWIRYMPWTVPYCKDITQSVYAFRLIRPQDVFYGFVRIAVIFCPVVTVALPMFLLILLYCLLIYRFNRPPAINKGRKLGAVIGSRPSVRDVENKLTKMVLIVVGVFFLFNLPVSIVFLLSAGVKSNFSFTLSNSIAVTTYLLILHKTLTFPVYCCASAEYRGKLKKLILSLNSLNRKASNDSTFGMTTTTTTFVVVSPQNENVKPIRV